MSSHLDLLEQITRVDSSYCWRYKYNWHRKVTAQIKAFGCRWNGAMAMELGAGVHNPLASSVLAVADGATECVAVEPGLLHDGFARLASLTACLSIALAARGDVNVPDRLARIADIREDATYRGGAVEGIQLFTGPVSSLESDRGFDVVHSNAVLEHICDFEATLESLWRLTAPSGIHVHQVDFADHRYYSGDPTEKAEMFRYMRQGDISELDVNKLRCSEMIAAFQDAGFVHVGTPEVWGTTPPPEVLADLADRYAVLPRSDIATTAAILVFRRP
jgi:hypothetical protein